MIIVFFIMPIPVYAICRCYYPVDYTNKDEVELI
jgi:hypothetical protein